MKMKKKLIEQENKDKMLIEEKLIQAERKKDQQKKKVPNDIIFRWGVLAKLK